jgi:hypothetical protein
MATAQQKFPRQIRGSNFTSCTGRDDNSTKRKVSFCPWIGGVKAKNQGTSSIHDLHFPKLPTRTALDFGTDRGTGWGPAWSGLVGGWAGHCIVFRLPIALVWGWEGGLHRGPAAMHDRRDWVGHWFFYCWFLGIVSFRFLARGTWAGFFFFSRSRESS